MEVHGEIRLFLDRDNAGMKWTESALAWSKKYRDESHLYKGYKDFNEWLSQSDKQQKSRQTLQKGL